MSEKWRTKRWQLHSAMAVVFVSSSASSPAAVVNAFQPTATCIHQSAPVRLQQRTSTTTVLLHCQLLGMNCAEASQFALTWPEFCSRGGETDIHADGWGLAYYQDQGLRQFHDVEAASTSPLAQFLGQQQIETRNLLAHIRYATTGSVNLANVHPFAREMWAFNWCFAHNGQVPLFVDHPDHFLGNVMGDRTFVPIGNTDSEATFCAILNALRAEFTDHMPSLPVLYEKLQSLCQEIVDYDPKGTILNFLLTCGPHVLWVYSWPGARPGSKVWNGLHYTVRTNGMTGDESNDMFVSVKSPDLVSIVATAPLTEDETWIELQPGELVVLDEGIPYVTARELFNVELHGHGLNNAGKVLNPPPLIEDMKLYQFEPDFFVAGGI